MTFKNQNTFPTDHLKPAYMNVYISPNQHPNCLNMLANNALRLQDNCPNYIEYQPSAS